jgi:hypothetical protein
MQHEREIDALLARGGTGSIFDRLMAMPNPAAGTNTGWDRVVSARLEAHLARRMRDAVGAGQLRPDAA